MKTESESIRQSDGDHRWADLDDGSTGEQGQWETMPQALGLWERRSMLSSATQPRWERVVFTVDSGASDTVVPPGVCSLAPLHHTEKVGTEHEFANSAIITNLGERRCLMRTSEKGAIINMKWQVVDVHKPFLFLGKMNDQGHDCVC